MATWFAQNSNVNIDSVNQWNSAANGSGSWLTWASLGASDVLVANGKTSITINVSFTCATITTAAAGGTAGGGFLLAAGVTVTSSVVSGTTTCIVRSASGATSYIVGNVTGGAGSTTYGISNTSTASVNVTGNLTGGSGTNAWAGNVNSGGQLNVTGNVTGGASGTANRGIGVSGSSFVTVTGNVSAGSAGDTSSGIVIQNNSTVAITGNVSASGGGVGIEIGGAITIPIVIVGTIQSSTTFPAIYSGTANAFVCQSGNISTLQNGRDVCGYITYRIHPSSPAEHQLRTYNTTTFADLGSRSLYTGGINVGHPAIVDVRSGTTFGAASEYTGTLAVPSPTLVAIGVATDNTVGSYEPGGGASAADIADAVWDEARSGHTTAGTFGEKVNAELDSAVGTQISKIEAAVAGTVTGAGTSTEVFVGPSATLTITVDSSGNRSAVVVT
jgi:hypothetical protein